MTEYSGLKSRLLNYCSTTSWAKNWPAFVH